MSRLRAQARAPVRPAETEERQPRRHCGHSASWVRSGQFGHNVLLDWVPVRHWNLSQNPSVSPKPGIRIDSGRGVHGTRVGNVRRAKKSDADAIGCDSYIPPIIPRCSGNGDGVNGLCFPVLRDHVDVNMKQLVCQGKRSNESFSVGCGRRRRRIPRCNERTIGRTGKTDQEFILTPTTEQYCLPRPFLRIEACPLLILRRCNPTRSKNAANPHLRNPMSFLEPVPADTLLPVRTRPRQGLQHINEMDAPSRIEHPRFRHIIEHGGEQFRPLRRFLWLM